MIKIDSYIGTHPRDALKVSEMPLTTLVPLFYQRVHNVRKRVRTLPEVASESLPEIFKGHGVARCPGWFTVAGGLKRAHRPLVIHWPTWIRVICTLFSDFPEVGFLIWYFLDPLLKRRSYFLHHLVCRELTHNALLLYPKKEYSDMPKPLSRLERQVLVEQLNLVAQQPVFLKACRDSWKETLPKITRPARASTYLVGRANNKVISPDECSVVFTREFSPSKIPADTQKRIVTPVDSRFFVNTEIKSLLYEFLYAMQIPTPSKEFNDSDIAKEFGVRLVRDGDRILLALNLMTFIAYRQDFDLSRYRAFSKSQELAKLAADTLNYITAEYKSRVDFDGSHLFGSDTGWLAMDESFTVYIDAEAIQHQAKLSNAADAVKRPRLRKAGYSVKPFSAVFIFKDIKSQTELRFSIGLYRKNVLFSPLWNDNFNKLVPETVRDSNVYRSSGVYYFERESRFYYNYYYLVKNMYELNNIWGAEEWLYRYSTMDYYLLKQAISAQQEVGNRQHKPFNDLERETILKYYRPGMTEDDRLTMLTACPGRTFISISRYARKLCDLMIADGIYDLEKLPHRKYNKDLLKRIRRAQNRKKFTA